MHHAWIVAVALLADGVPVREAPSSMLADARRQPTAANEPSEPRRAYKSCEIANGRVIACAGAWYQGRAVVERDGTYHVCEIANGQVFACDGAWYQGTTVVVTER